MLTFDKKYLLRISDYDAYDRLRPASILDLFQDAAGEHADLIGVGYEKLIKQNIIWVLLRSRYEVIENPPLYAEVTVKTWPHERGRGDFDRDYLILGDGGKVLVKGSSKWCVCNFVTRKILFGDEVKYNDDEYFGQAVFPEGLKKISDFPTEGFTEYKGKSAFCDLDHNGHVNNIKYADFILNALRPEKGTDITSLEIDYIREMKADGDYSLFLKEDENGCLIKCVSSGNQIFRARVKTKKAGL
ncbi:MAG: hypothetical protein IJS67_00815 [Clostridia bacterium]|nr:hypothetical protein [Clostridia bacterium]